jgi:hypothetical protein
MRIQNLNILIKIRNNKRVHSFNTLIKIVNNRNKFLALNNLRQNKKKINQKLQNRKARMKGFSNKIVHNFNIQNNKILYNKKNNN